MGTPREFLGIPSSLFGSGFSQFEISCGSRFGAMPAGPKAATGGPGASSASSEYTDTYDSSNSETEVDCGGGESDQKERLEGVKEEGAEEEGGGEEDQARARLTLTPAPWRQQSQAGIPPAT